jgi:hypothetical protein
MGFEFGLANDLDPSISLYCFIAVVIFLIFFDYITGILEFFLERSPLYNRMLQLIYKELMLMGLVSFGVIMYEASATHEEVATATDDHHVTTTDDHHVVTDDHHYSPSYSPTTHHRLLSSGAGPLTKNEKIIISIDFAHILLFYITLCFVLHAFFLMGISILNERKYHRLAAEEIDSLIAKVKNYSKNPVWKFLFEFPFWPFSSVKSHVEFHLLKEFFQKTYLVSLNFDFAAYISISFGRYALRTINRSLFSWFVFLAVIVVNYCRIAAGFSCHGNVNYTDPVFHKHVNCDNFAIRLFLFAGICLAVYFALLLFVSNYYRNE